MPRERNPREEKTDITSIIFDNEGAENGNKYADCLADIKDISFGQTVAKGQKIAVYHSAERGVDGFLTDGTIRKGFAGRQLPILTGIGIRSEKNSTVYYSDVDGWIQIKDKEIVITPLLTLDNVTADSERIDFEGYVHVNGSVFENNEIRATMGIIIDKTAYISKLYSGGDVIIRGGMTANNKGVIEAKGSVVAGFLEDVTVNAGKDIFADSVINANLNAGENIRICGKIGKIHGGKCYAGFKFEANTIGTDSGNTTNIQVGVTSAMSEEIAKKEEEIGAVAAELKLIEDTYKKYVSEHKGDSPEEQNILLRLENARYTKLLEYKEKKEESKNLTEKMKQHKKAKICVNKELRENVFLVINNNHVLPDKKRGEIYE